MSRASLYEPYEEIKGDPPRLECQVCRRVVADVAGARASHAKVHLRDGRAALGGDSESRWVVVESTPPALPVPQTLANGGTITYHEGEIPAPGEPVIAPASGEPVIIPVLADPNDDWFAEDTAEVHISDEEIEAGIAELQAPPLVEVREEVGDDGELRVLASAVTCGYKVMRDGRSAPCTNAAVGMLHELPACQLHLDCEQAMERAHG